MYEKCIVYVPFNTIVNFSICCFVLLKSKSTTIDMCVQKTFLYRFPFSISVICNSIFKQAVYQNIPLIMYKISLATETKIFLMHENFLNTRVIIISSIIIIAYKPTVDLDTKQVHCAIVFYA